MDKIFLDADKNLKGRLQEEEKHNREEAIEYLENTKVANLRKMKHKNGKVMVLTEKDEKEESFARYKSIFNHSSLDKLANELNYGKHTLYRKYMGYEYFTEEETSYVDSGSYTIRGDKVTHDGYRQVTLKFHYARKVEKEVSYDVYVKCAETPDVIEKEKEFIKDHDYYFASKKMPTTKGVDFGVFFIYLLSILFFATSIIALLFSNQTGGSIAEYFFLNDLLKKIPEIYILLTHKAVMWAFIFAGASIIFLILAFVTMKNTKGTSGIMDKFRNVLTVATYFIGITYVLILLGKVFTELGDSTPLLSFLLLIEALGIYVGEPACIAFFSFEIVVCVLGLLSGGYGATISIKRKIIEYGKQVDNFKKTGGLDKLKTLKIQICENSSYYFYFVDNNSVDIPK